MKREPDMSERAVENRLEVLRQLYKLGTSLREIRPPESAATARPRR